MNATNSRLESAVRAAAKQNGLMLRKTLVRKAEGARSNIYGLTEIATNARVIGHPRLKGRGVSLEVCAHILAERAPEFHLNDYWVPAGREPGGRQDRRLENCSDSQFDQLMDRLINSPPDENSIAKQNLVTRLAKLDEIMRKPLGDNWEFYLSYNITVIPVQGDQPKVQVPLEPYARLRGESFPAMLEKLDRKGRLVRHLTIEEVQAASTREIELRKEGEEQGRACAAEVPPPQDFTRNSTVLNNWSGANQLGVAGEFNAYGRGWFEGFISGATEVWKSIPPLL